MVSIVIGVRRRQLALAVEDRCGAFLEGINAVCLVLGPSQPIAERSPGFGGLSTLPGRFAGG